MLAGLSNLPDYSALCQREGERNRRRSGAKRKGRNRRPAGSTASLLSSSDINFTVEGETSGREGGLGDLKWGPEGMETERRP